MEQVTVTWLLKHLTGAAPWLGFEEKSRSVAMFCRGCNALETFSTQLLTDAVRYTNGGRVQVNEYTSGVSIDFRRVPSLYRHLRCGQNTVRYSVPVSFSAMIQPPLSNPWAGVSDTYYPPYMNDSGEAALSALKASRPAAPPARKSGITLDKPKRQITLTDD